jgi:hypothetical protein
MFERHGAVMLIISPDDGRIVHANQAAARFYGYPLSELQSLTIHAVSQVSYDEVDRAMAEAKAGRRTRFEFPHRLADGEIRHVVIHASPVSFRHRTLLFSILHDITGRRKAEDLLRFTQYVVDHMTDGVFWARADGRLAYVNEAACQRLGYSREELLTLRVTDLVAEYTEAQWADHWRAVKERGSLVFESRHVRKDGGVFPVEIRTTFVHFEGEEYACGIVSDITARKHAESAVCASEERLRLIVEATPLALLMGELETGRVLLANESFCELFGYQRDVIMTMRSADFYADPERDRPRIAAALREHGRIRQWEVPARRADGTVFDALLSYELVQYGGQAAAVGVVYDLTERKRGDAALRASEEKFRLLVETSADVIWTINEAGRFTYVSPAIMQLRGLTPQEAMRESISEAVCPEFLPRITEALGRSAESRKSGNTGFTDHMEIQQPRKDGSRVWVEIITRELHDESGRRAGALGISRNINRRKQAEAQLLESRRLLEAQNQELRKLIVAIEQSGNTVVITDLDGTILYANPRFEETTGYTSREALGQNPRILKSGELDEPHYRAMWDAISGGQIWRGEFHNKRKDGSLYWEAATIAPVTGADGRITNYIAIKEDITERKEAQEALLRYARQLEAQNAELDAYAHTVAHDLKGPLGVLVGFSELLAETPSMAGDEQTAMLDHIRQIGWQMTRIVDALLLLSATRRKQVKIEPLETARIVDAVQERLGPMIDEVGAEIRLPDAWPPSVGYAPWVEEVWVNYLSNAIKYGGRPPRVELGAALLADGQVRFWVRDNGEGIGPDDQQKLFAPFTRLRQVSIEGHGLGLSIVRRIVERLGGVVGVESELGQGSLFFFTLPQAQTASADSPPPSLTEIVP